MNTPLLNAFNSFHTKIRWCTPSIHPDLPQVRDIYANDMSVSYHKIGSPLTDTGLFGEATALAAKAYQADHTLFCVQGTTMSNFMVLRTLKNQLGDVRMVATRNAHMSIITGCKDYGITLIPIEPQYNQDLQIFTPNTLEQIMDGVKKHQPNVLFLSNPTYEGNSLDLKAIVAAVREYDPNIIIYVDEGWGAHFCFSPELPTSAMQAGADICTQSTHKQGCSLQQNSMIHWKDGRVNAEEVLRSYRSLSTTSPSFHLLAALDGTRAFMEARGEEVIGQMIEVAEYFVEQLRTVPDIEVHVSSDPTKILLHIPNHNASLIAEAIEAAGIIPEKYEVKNITLIVGFQSTKAEVDTTVETLKKVIKRMKPETITFPKFPITIETKPPVDTTPEAVSLDKAVGRVCDEYIIPYPPGIPVLAPGEVIRSEHIEYIRGVQAQHDRMTLFMSEPTTIRVV
ncbi:MAG TPA: hypothetical protein VHT70_01945 [Candidatus Saccharimonadales bacterium]|jgi:arginine/lysine/ornithine decarboxylase|nr:hypothetical protein [Candidatus Saccharimonadales bacterium]